MGWVAIDFETANEHRDSACALGLAVVEGGQVVTRRSWLIRPSVLEFNPYNVAIHGITAADVAHAPNFADVWPEAGRWIGQHPLVAHNANFDVSVLRHCLDEHDLAVPEVPIFCTRVLAKRVWPDLDGYSLPYLAGECGIRFQHHDAEEDAVACALLALNCCDRLAVTELSDAASAVGIIPGLLSRSQYQPCRSAARKRHRRPNEFIPNTDAFDEDHPLFGTTVVFTGTLMSMVRDDAIQRVVDLGGDCATSISKKVDFLVVGDQDFARVADPSGSRKLLKARELRSAGADIEIIPEQEFLRMLGPD